MKHCTKRRTMKTLLVIFFFHSAFAGMTREYDLDESVFPTTPIKDLKTLQYFAEIVKENKMNVTLITSKNEKFRSNNVLKRNEGSISITSTLNKVSLREPNLSEEQGRKFLKTATEEKLAARVYLSKGNESQGWANNLNSVPVTRSHKILASVKNGSTGFTWDDKNYISQYTFLTPGEDGRNEVTKIFFGNLDIKVTSSENFTPEEIKLMKSIFATSYYLFVAENYCENFASLIRSNLKGDKWAVISGVGQNNYLKATKSITLELFNKTYLIYTV